jgi:hypothetical protein
MTTHPGHREVDVVLRDRSTVQVCPARPSDAPAVHWPLTPATAFWILISDPGAFIMERRMLKGIRARAERSARSADASIGANSGPQRVEASP